MSRKEIKINKYTGVVSVNGFDVDSSTTLADLPSTFETEKERIVKVMRKKIPCQFSSYVNVLNNIETKIELRFERNRLVSVFFYLSDLTKEYNNAIDFYSSTDERKQMHKNWLQSQLGEEQDSSTIYKWGKIGIAQDKSDNVHIYMHNENNSWA